MSYKLINQTDTQLAHIQFKGPFQGKTVTWDTHFFTLNGYVAHTKNKDEMLKQFIMIESIEDGLLKLTVALKIPEINHQNIQKMMIMVKQYRNLSLGRHEYG